MEIRPPRRSIRLGKYQFPLGKADVRLLRKSTPFWNILSRHGIFSCILRVPITFPPEKLRGVLLSAMCVPDLRGTQGMFSYYTTRPQAEGERIGGEVHRVARDGDTIQASLIGPASPFRAGEGDLRLPFVVKIQGPDRAILKIDGAKYELRKDVYTEWIQVQFSAVPGVKVKGICKFLLLEGEPEFGLYVMPINIDPEHPAMPVGYPAVYSVYLAKKQGPFATLGLAEDTWALNEHVINDDHFIQQCLDIDGERELMFFDSLDKVPQGLCVCVFDGTDRLQHTFWRDIDERHPARPDQSVLDHRHVIEDLYRRMDDLVGRTVAKCKGNDTLLMVLSDHGFNPFRRGVDLNRWLEENGYLTLHDGRRYEEHLAGVDWSKTRAFAIGLTGIFINVKGKYSQGIVEAGDEADRLRDEIAERLTALIDPEIGRQRRQASVCRQEVLQRALQGQRSRSDRRLSARLSRLVGDGHRPDDRGGLPLQHQGLERRPLRRSVLVPGILFCNRSIENDEPAADRHRSHGAEHVRRGGPRIHGRQGAGGWRRRGIELEPNAKISVAKVG